ncbi:MAG: lytic murein transglycosylase [Alsobacter sp.]
MTTLPRALTLPLAAAALAASILGAGGASAATCKDPAGFDKFLDDIRKEAAAKGVSQRAIAASLDGVTFDQSIVNRDRGQRVFKQTFEEFSGRMISKYRLTKGASLLKQYAGPLARIETQYGVPGPVLVALWGLETDFGAYAGNFATIRSVASLAYDCRRTEMFQAELIDAMRIVDRGDLQPSQMKGAWAGELGQTQFMPSSYMKYAVDFDGDGRRDLMRSPVDVLASTAAYLAGYGWQRGQPWDEGTPNFQVIKQWNKAQVYAKTIALYADKLAATVQ